MIMDWLQPFLTTDNIIRFVAIVGGAITFLGYFHNTLITLKSDVSQIKEQQKILMESLRQLNTILTEIAVQNVRLNMIEKDIDDLRHKRGFIE